MSIKLDMRRRYVNFNHMSEARQVDIVVVGAGFGGLSAAARLAHAGLDVLVVETAEAPGGKARAMPSVAGPVAAGPTVLTMRGVFDALFQELGDSLDARVGLSRAEVIARHGWEDGARLDLFADPAASEAAIRDFAGPRAAAEFAAFDARSRRLFRAFEGPVMRSPAPSAMSVALALGPSAPALLAEMAPGATLWSALGRAFSDPRLRQLFARYATYVGGSPFLSPALLMLIWQAESAGVWRVAGELQALAAAVADLAARKGARFRHGAEVARILQDRGRAAGVELADGERIAARAVIFNGDPDALSQGLLGPTGGVPRRRPSERSLSADVWALAARAEGFPLLHHNVLFGPDPKTEFDPIFDRGQRPRDPTLYICAQDRGDAAAAPEGPERFEIIVNAPPGAPEEFDLCLSILTDRLARWGLTLSPTPTRSDLTTPQDFARRFPGTEGAIYGSNPHGATAALRRPTARTRLPGLFLAGGGAHPGPGVPMATLSGRFAAAAALKDLGSTRRFRPAATPGGTSTE